MRDINIFETDMFPYLEGEEIKGKTLTLTIRDIRAEEMQAHGGRKETKEVLYFAETKKGFVLNKTNSKTIAMMHGRQTGQWNGKRIVLTTEPVQAFGQLHNALRVILGAISDDNGEMDLEKLLFQLGRLEKIKGFYFAPFEILDCRKPQAEIPEPDDIDGWRTLFADARDYALSEMEQVENDPNQPMPRAHAEQHASADEVVSHPMPGSVHSTDHEVSAMDEVEADASEEDEIPTAFQ